MKYSRIFFAVLLWEGLLWLVFNGHLLRDRIWILFDRQVIYEQFYLWGDYYGPEARLLVLTISAVVVTEAALRTETVAGLIRHRDRAAFYQCRWKTLAAVSAMYAAIHLAMGYALSAVLFPGAFVTSRQTGCFYAVSAPLLTLFLLRVTVIYVGMRDFFRKKLFAMAGVLALYIAAYFIGCFVLKDIWLPCKDVDLGVLAYREGLSVPAFLLAVVRQGGIAGMIAVLCRSAFAHRDVIQIEK